MRKNKRFPHLMNAPGIGNNRVSKDPSTVSTTPLIQRSAIDGSSRSFEVSSVRNYSDAIVIPVSPVNNKKSESSNKNQRQVNQPSNPRNESQPSNLRNQSPSHQSNQPTSLSNQSQISQPPPPSNLQRKSSSPTTNLQDGGKLSTPPSPPGAFKRLLSVSQQILIMNSKACNVVPERADFGCCQNTTDSLTHAILTRDEDQYQHFLLEQYGFNPSKPNEEERVIEPLGAFEKTVGYENGSQYVNPNISPVRSIWNQFEGLGSDVVSIDERRRIRKRHGKDKAHRHKNEKHNQKRHSHMKKSPSYNPQDVLISEVPRMKLIAVKFSRLKCNNIEIRKLDEKIVCVEYDVYDKLNIQKQPVDTMRAFFSIKSGCEKCSNKCTFLAELPSNLKTKLKLDESNLDQFIEKEVELLDDKIPGNKSYVDDLRRIMHRQQAISAKKDQSSLDLKCMYHMARCEIPPLEHDFSNTNLLSKKELQRIQSLILKQCESRVNELSRKKVTDLIPAKCSFEASIKPNEDNVIYNIIRNMET